MRLPWDYLVVDIGSKTTDVVLLKNGMPVERKSITVEKAMVKWIKQIQGRLQIQYGKNVPESEILKVVLKKDSFLPRSQANHVREILKELVHGLELELMEREFDLQYTNVIYVGGGAVPYGRGGSRTVRQTHGRKDYMKQILKEHFENKDRENEQNEWLERFREEMADVVEQAVRKCIGACNVNVMGTGIALMVDTEAEDSQEEARLPEQSEEMPEGALDFMDGME